MDVTFMYGFLNFNMMYSHTIEYVSQYTYHGDKIQLDIESFLSFYLLYKHYSIWLCLTE